MGMNSSGPISLAGTTVGQSIEIENGGNGTTQISLNDAAVRTLANVPSGQISMPTDFYGKSNIFYVTVSTNQTDMDLRTYAVNSGWDQNRKLVVTLNSGIGIIASSPSTYALTIAGSFPKGVSFVNNGLVQGAGGQGGQGSVGGNRSGGGGGGGAGGNAINVSTAVSITNNATIAGGGGGGGGSGSQAYTGGSGKSTYTLYSAGGGGGGGAGIANGIGGSGGYNNWDGTTGGTGGTSTSTAGGGGGAGAPNYTQGGGGGGLGQVGNAGGSGSNGGGGPGGSAGYYLVGNSYVTWVVVGTRLGNVS